MGKLSARRNQETQPGPSEKKKMAPARAPTQTQARPPPAAAPGQLWLAMAAAEKRVYEAARPHHETRSSVRRLSL